jgi:hypothetical protein
MKALLYQVLLRVYALSFPKQTVIWKTHKLKHNGLPAKLYQDCTTNHSHKCVRDVSGYQTPIFHMLTIAGAPAAHHIHPTLCPTDIKLL